MSLGSTTTLLVGLLVFSFLFVRVLQKTHAPAILNTGSVHLILGLVLGPIGLGLVTTGTLQALTPLTSLLTGILGFLIGIRARDLPGREGWPAGVLIALYVLALVGFSVLVATSALYALTERMFSEAFFEVGRTLVGGEMVRFAVSDRLFWMCLALGGAAAVTASSVVVSDNSRYKPTGPIPEWLVSIARTSELLIIAMYGILLSVSRSLESANALGLSVTEWTVAATGAGVCCGLLFTLFIGREGEENRIYFASLGAIIFGSGIGEALGVSPMFVNLVTGLTVAMSSRHVARLRSAMETLEMPVFVLVFILAGAHWLPVKGWEWAIPAVYLVFRYVGYATISTFAVKHTVSTHPKLRHVGRSLLPQDAIPLAIGLSFAGRFPDLASLVLSTIIVGYLFSNLLSINSLRNLYVDEQVLPQPTDKTPEQGGDA